MRGVRALEPHALPSGSLSPAQVLTAYGFKQNQYAGALPVKLGIGSLGGGVVQRDIDNMVATWGMAAPHVTVRTVGGATNDPTSDQDSNVENMLDLGLVAFTWWWLTGTPADVTITFGPNASGGMEAVTRDLASAGVEVGSWSWGAAASAWDPNERAALAKAFSDAVSISAVCFCAASGDNSIDDGTSVPSADYPCADPNVWAVGGTFLAINPDGSRADEAAWGDGNPGDEGGGGGFDPTVPIPAWQKSSLPTNAPGRGVPDTSANADPNSGWQISANGAWTVVGGTSAASPFTAAIIAVAKGAAKSLDEGLTTPAPYSSSTACNDITKGSDGDATTVGWDGATGLGSPNGDGFVQAIIAWANGQAQPPAPAPQPPPLPVPPPPAEPPTLDPDFYNEFDVLGWAAQGIVDHWPDDGSQVSLEEAQAWASAGIEDNWPVDDG